MILDCTLDASNQEQMSSVLRCVDVSNYPINIEKYFVEFFRVDDTIGQGLFEE